MKRNIIVTLTLVALSLLTVSTSFAQDKLKANVPFSFQVGKSSLSAGTYSVSNAANGVIRLQNKDAGSAVLASYFNAEKLKAEQPKMVFHKYGSSYFLVEIWDGAGTSGMQFPESKREKELRASNQGSASDELIVVAMK
jgi:hypothetical protein